MKKALILLLLLPFVAFSQTLLTWNTTGTPTQNNTNLVGQSMQMGGGVSIAVYNNTDPFITLGWHNNAGSTLDYTKYIEFRATANTGYNLSPTAFTFNYNTSGGDQGPTMVQVRYSTSSTFADGGTLLGSAQTLVLNQNTQLTLNFPSGYTVASGTTLYMRLYAYKPGTTNWWYSVMNINRTASNSSLNGPQLLGTTPAANGIIANPDSASTDYLTPITLSVTSNDTATGTTISSVSVVSGPSHGTATVVNNTQIKYTPTNGYTGADSFTYKVIGANGNESNNGTVSMTVTTPPSPTAVNDTASTLSTQPVTISVTSNDTASGTTISSVTVASNPSYGTVSVVNGTQIKYTPNGTYSGNDTFTYKAVGANGMSSTAATVTVTVTAYVAPVATTDTATTTKNTATTIAVTSNDTAGNGTISSIAVVSAPAHGTATVSGTSVLYTPTTDYIGADAFSYKLTNSYGYTATGTVNVTVNQPAPSGPLNGTYVISGTTQYEYQQFSTITAAVNYLNTYGISGAVKFLLKDASYTNTTETFPFTINTIANSSATKTVTFKPYSGKTVNITATNVNTSTGVPAIFILKGADYVIFDGSNVEGGTSRNLKFANNDNIDYIQRSVIWIASNGSADGATHNTIKYCYMRMGTKNGGYSYCAGIYSGKYEIGGNNTMTPGAAEADNSYLTILKNDLDNVKQGVYINGGTTPTSYTVIQGNDLGATVDETIICPATFSNAKEFTYTENYVYNLYRNTAAGDLISSGVLVTGNSYNGTITRNQMKTMVKTLDNGDYFGGIVLKSTNTASNILVANNFIADVSGYCSANNYHPGGYGIVVATGGGYKIYHNSVNLTLSQTGSGTGFSAALLVEAATNLDVRNNIFVNNQPTADSTRSFGVIINLANTSGFTYLNYNNIYGEYLGYLGTNITGESPTIWDGSNNPNYGLTIGGWKTTTGKEANSVSVSPAFYSNTDLHINANSAVNSSLNDAGTPIAAVTKDIDNQTRNTTTPDIGADEFGAISFPTGTGTAGIYCDSSTVYNGSTWSNGTPTADKDAIIASGTFTQSGSTFYACSLYVLNGATAIFTGNSTAVVTHSVNVQTTGTLTFDSGSNLIQIEADYNAGTATIKRDGGYLKRLDYTMWCAPVYDSRTTGFQTLKTFSPATAAGRYYRYETSTNYYMPEAEATTKFAQGKGYLIRMPNLDATPGYNTGTARLTFTGAFQGTPNNGNIRTALDYTDDAHGYNVIGNPYPSPISAVDFINANLSSTTGSIWIWRKTNDQTKTTYCTINLSGYAANNAPGGDSADGNYTIMNPYDVAPNKGFLNTAQGFMVKATGTGKEALFRNDMRITTQSASFFKSATAATAQEQEEINFGDRVWLNATSAAGDFSQTLIAYNPATTTGLDSGYDSEGVAPGNINLYTLLNQAGQSLSMTIQTRGGFANTDVVPVGFTATTAGTYTISLDNMDGIFAEGQKVYLRDDQEGIVRELTQNSYTFATEAGTFETRFTVFYTTEAALGTDNPVQTAPTEVIVYNNNNEIKATAPQAIKSVVVYDTLGRMLYQNAKVNSTEFASGVVNSSKQVVIVNLTLENGQVIAKKIMMN